MIVSLCPFFLNDEDDDSTFFLFLFFFIFFFVLRRGGSVRWELECSMPSGSLGRGKDGIEDETIWCLLPMLAVVAN